MRLSRDTRLAGERIELLSHRRENYPFYARWYGDEEIWRLTSWADAPLSEPAVERLFDERGTSFTDSSFAIHRLGEPAPIGVISLTNIKRANNTADLSVIVGPPGDRERGYGAEAIDLILGYGFEELGLQSVGLSVFEFNEQAISVYEKLGFRRNDRIRQAVKRDGKLYDAILMNIAESEWRTHRRNGEEPTRS